MPEAELDLVRTDAELLRQAIDGLADHSLVVVDRVYCVRFWSRGAELMFGRSAVDTLGLRLDAVFADDHRCWDLPNDHSHGRAVAAISKRCWFTLSDGSRRLLDTTAAPLRHKESCVGFALYAREAAAGPGPSDASSECSLPSPDRVTELSETLLEMADHLEAAKAERVAVEMSRIRQLRRTATSVEEERRRLAHHLREHIGQQMSALQLAIEALATDAGHEPRTSEDIRPALEMVGRINRGLDAVARELRPAALDELGLIATLREYVPQWSRHAGISGTFHSVPHDGERLPPEVETTLYRIAQTALEGAAQGGASAVNVLLERYAAAALLVVEDNSAAIESRDTTGVTHIRERAAALGGSVEIEPTPAGGSTIRVRVPLPAAFDPGSRETEESVRRALDHDSPLEPVVANDGGGWVNLLQTRLAELRTAVAARDEFIATVAHELRNPVSPLIFQIRLAIEKTEQWAEAKASVSPEWVQSQFRRIEQRLHRLLETLDRLLDVSQLATGRVDLQPEPVDLVRTVREIVSSFEAELAVARCPLTLEERYAPTGFWDPLRLEQICRNLLSNAIRFGAGTAIEVSIDGDRDMAILEVRDHGIGIAPDLQSRIFERFERGVDQRSGSFGIGLWVVKNICTAMGGTVGVVSTVGAGACFTVVLPRCTSDSSHPAHSHGPHHGTQ